MSLFGSLAPSRNEPIKGVAEARERKTDFRQHPISTTGQAYLEPLVDLRDAGIAGENYYYSHRNPPYWRRIPGAIPRLAVRRSVAEKLKRVNARLEAETLELYVFDAWRPRAVQSYFHDHWVPQELKRRRPELSGNELTREVERYWARPTTDAASPAPHATGGAIDLTARWIGAEQLFMGSLFDDPSDVSHRDRFETLNASALSFSDEEARGNRRLLHWVMTEEGFAGHPDEWWHFSWGDQLWAKLTGAPAALYGEAEPPSSL